MAQPQTRPWCERVTQFTSFRGEGFTALIAVHEEAQVQQCWPVNGANINQHIDSMELQMMGIKP